MHWMRVIGVVCLVSLLTPAQVFADLGAFRRDVEREEKHNRTVEREASSADDDESGSPLFSLLLEITVYAWTIHNGIVMYTPYPYSFSEPGYRHFIGYDRSRWVDDGFHVRPSRPRTKRHWFEVTGGGLATDDGDYGGFASLQGRFVPFLGPDLDYRVFYDGSTSLRFITAGIDLPLIQHDFFSWSLYGKAAFFRGELERDGAAAGMSIRSYVGQPVSLFFRLGALSFDSISFAQVEGRFNVHQGRFFLFGGGNLLQSQSSRLLTLETGVGLVF